MANSAFVSWVAEPSCKALDGAMQALNKAWQRYNEQGEVDEKVLKHFEKAIGSLDKASAATDYAELELTSVILEEIKDILAEMSSGAIPRLGFEAISYALVRLPTYIRLVASGVPDLSAALFDVLNVVRLVQGKSPHVERDWTRPIAFDEVKVRHGAQELSSVVPGFLSFLRSEIVPSLPVLLDSDDLFFVLEDTEKQLQALLSGKLTQRQNLFTWLMQAIVANAKLNPKRLDLLTVLCLSEASQVYFSLFSEEDPSFADAYIKDDFLYLLVLVIGYALDRSESGDQVLERMGVSEAFHQKQDVEKVRSQLAGADLSSMEDVYPLLLDGLGEAERELNLSSTNGRFKGDRLLAACEDIGRIGSTLEVLGDPGLASELRTRADALVEKHHRQSSYEELSRAFEALADGVLFVKRTLDAKVNGSGVGIFSDLPLDPSAIRTFLKEARSELRTIRQKLGLHFETGEADAKLLSSVRKLGVLSSSMSIIDLGDTANVVRHLAIFLHRAISANEAVEGEQLALTATALTAVELRLEYLSRGLIPPDHYIVCAKNALSDLFDGAYSESLPALPDAFMRTENEEPASADDMLPLIHSIARAAEKWDGTRNETWQGLVNLFSELATIASLLEYRIVTRLARDVVDLARHVQDATTWSDDLAELAFEFINQIAKTLINATAEDPHLPENCISDLMRKKEVLQGHLTAEIEADRLLEIDDSAEEAPAHHQEEASTTSDSEIDEELIAIFSKEFTKLSGTLNEALDDFLEVPEAAVPSEKLIHCCHTLKGVSHTIERPEMSEVFGLWEDIFNERQSDNVALNPEEIQLFKDSVQAANDCVAGLRSGKRFPNSEAILARLKEIDEDGQQIDGHRLEGEMEPELPLEGAAAVDSSRIGTEANSSTLLEPGMQQHPNTQDVQIEGFTPHDGNYEEEMLALYLEEAASELYKLDDFIHDLDQNPGDEDLHVEIKRLMHTLKGSSNMAGAATIGFITHEMEELLSGLEVGSIKADTLFVRLLSAAMDVLRQLTQFAENRQVLPSPWNLLAAIQYANENDELTEELVNNALKEGMTLGSDAAGGAAQDAAPSDKSDDQAKGNAGPSLTEDPHPTDDSHTAKLAPGQSVPKSQGGNGPRKQQAPKVKRVAPSFLDIKDGESFSDTLQRLRSLRFEQRQSGISAGATPPKVKVDTQLLDRLIDSAFEVNVDRDRVVMYQESMERSETVLRKLTDHVESMQASLFAELQKIDSYHRDHPEMLAPEYLDHFSALKALNRDLEETSLGIRDVQERIKEQTSQARTTIKQLTKTTRSLRENLFNTRLVPIKNMLSALRTVTNKTGDMVNKKLVFDMEGETTQIDRNLLDTLTNNRALEHLIRNSGDHGIESPDERVAKGKPATGQITLKAMHEGDRIFLKLRDDGAGIDPQKVKAKAVDKGLIEPDADLSEHEILQLITSSGFSTADSVTQVSGRGVGMDVVRSTIESLGGSLSINSVLGEGTEFVLDLPYTQGVSRALVLGVGEARFAIPTTVIQSFGYVSKDDLGKTSITFEGRTYDWMSLNAICGLEHEQAPFVPGQKVGLVIINDPNRPFAVACESIDGMQALHLKPVPFFKHSLKGVLGLAETIDGTLLTVLDPRELRTTMTINDGGGFVTRPGFMRQPPTKSKPLAIVADDSVALRKSATRFLERIGYQVLPAQNGREAMDLMDKCYPSILVTDLEMPQMDGFELTRGVRGHHAVKRLPVVMVTSRNTEEIEREAFESGVNCFLPKPFNAEMLADAVAKATSMEVRTA